jgi:hypothetical protein
MYVVDEIAFNQRSLTRIWASGEVLQTLEEFQRKNKATCQQFMRKLEWWCKNGFAIGEKTGDIVHEGEGVYRVGIKSSLFRILGFYENEPKKDSFIAIEAYLKKGLEVGTRGRAKIEAVTRTRTGNDWRKENSKQTDYPRLVDESGGIQGDAGGVEPGPAPGPG